MHRIRLKSDVTSNNFITMLPQHGKQLFKVKDWRQALKSAPSYRVGPRNFYLQRKVCYLVVSAILIYLVYQYSDIFTTSRLLTTYNNTYPLSAPIVSEGIRTYRLGIIADLDKKSKGKDPNTWVSYYRKGYLSYNEIDQSVVISWDKTADVELRTSYASAGRGMECSELVVFDGRLLTFDDRSGIVYEIENDRARPWILLMDGDGRTIKGFKSEWATVKDEKLYVGSMGKEYTSASGVFQSYNPQYIKIISPSGEVQHLSWVNQFEAVRNIMGITFPGYLMHESGVWSDIHKKWFFLPRRCSAEPYNETRDEVMGCNVMISADEYFKTVQLVKVGDINPIRGFSSFKFIPATGDQIAVALKTEEYLGKTTTYITAFSIKGSIIFPDTLVSSELKFEGLEFI